jgi:hypothetical protein
MPDITLSLTLIEALNLQSACMAAAQHYAKLAAGCEQSDTRDYWEKRFKESREGAELLKRAMHNPKWESQLDLIHDISHNHWHE